ncbi:unnamed protein product [Cyprideis torosa]|uniref:Uncharacterized protein n=1 Tax=Cyprideis torosa TaxID=163714 RepID=A0A7R8ZIB4_9CRUS|nr:unnamed protein product [Cyprideis torosa]CAG0885712.1 unnamed protein product [Cyprideis torosa]
MNREEGFGIHIGNTSMSIAVLRQRDKVEVLANPEGYRVIPSLISVRDGEIEVGMAAKREMIRNQSGTLQAVIAMSSGFPCGEIPAVNSSVRSEGDDDNLTFNFPGLSLDRRTAFSALFEQLRGRNLSVVRRACFPVMATGGPPSPDFSREEQRAVIRFLFHKGLTGAAMCREFEVVLRVIASSNATKPPPYDAVVAVSNCFISSSAATRDLVSAASEKGFQVLKVLPSCLLPIVAYPSDLHDCGLYLVLHIGGLSLEAQCLRTVMGCTYNVGSKIMFGWAGDDILEAFTAFLAGEFNRKHRMDPMTQYRPRAKLLRAAEDVMQRLSRLSTAQLCVESLMDGIDFEVNVTRARFEIAVQKNLEKIVSFVLDFMKDIELKDIKAIKKVYVSGGASQIPALKIAVRQTFASSGCSILDSIAGDQCLAIGAAKQLNNLFDTFSNIPKNYSTEANGDTSRTKGSGKKLANGNAGKLVNGTGTTEQNSTPVVNGSAELTCVSDIKLCVAKFTYEFRMGGFRVVLCQPGMFLPVHSEFELKLTPGQKWAVVERCAAVDGRISRTIVAKHSLPTSAKSDDSVKIRTVVAGKKDVKVHFLSKESVEINSDQTAS